jgi:hypothetical protein
MNWEIWHRISIFWYVEHVLQRTIISDSNLGRILLDIRCPLCRRIRVYKLDRAFRRIFEQRGGLQYLHRSPWHAFSVLPSC